MKENEKQNESINIENEKTKIETHQDTTENVHDSEKTDLLTRLHNGGNNTPIVGELLAPLTIEQANKLFSEVRNIYGSPLVVLDRLSPEKEEARVRFIDSLEIKFLAYDQFGATSFAFQPTGSCRQHTQSYIPVWVQLYESQYRSKWLYKLQVICSGFLWYHWDLEHDCKFDNEDAIEVYNFVTYSGPPIQMWIVDQLATLIEYADYVLDWCCSWFERKENDSTTTTRRW